MRKAFESALGQYNTVAKDEMSGELVGEELEAVLKWVKKQAEAVMPSQPERQDMIYRLQLQKQALMQHLKEQLRCIDDPDCVFEQRENAHAVTYDTATDLFSMKTQEGETLTLTTGELLTDGEWGLAYTIDKNTWPRDIQKKYLVEETKRDLRHYMNSQIMAGEFNSKLKHTPTDVGAIHDSRMRSLAQQVHHPSVRGFALERLVTNMLHKMVHDHGAPLSVTPADEYEDRKQKIDLIVKLAEHTRGVHTEGADVQHIGVQLTSATHGTYWQKKKRTLEEVRDTVLDERRENEQGLDDIALVMFPLSELEGVLNTWLAHPTPGGPDALLDFDRNEELYAKVLQHMASETEIAQRHVVLERARAAHEERRTARVDYIRAHPGATTTSTTPRASGGTTLDHTKHDDHASEFSSRMSQPQKMQRDQVTQVGGEYPEKITTIELRNTDFPTVPAPHTSPYGRELRGYHAILWERISDLEFDTQVALYDYRHGAPGSEAKQRSIDTKFEEWFLRHYKTTFYDWVQQGNDPSELLKASVRLRI